MCYNLFKSANTRFLEIELYILYVYRCLYVIKVKHSCSLDYQFVSITVVTCVYNRWGVTQLN